MILDYKEEDTGVPCTHCGGGIVVRKMIPVPSIETISMSEDMKILGYYCPVCGIEYRKLPGNPEFNI